MPDYQARLNTYTDGQEPLAMQQETPAILLELIDGVNETKLQARPAPGKWSVGEILAHLAEDELATSWRYRQMIEHCGCDLASFDQDQWADLGNYASWNPKKPLSFSGYCVWLIYECLDGSAPMTGKSLAFTQSEARSQLQILRGTWPVTT